MGTNYYLMPKGIKFQRFSQSECFNTVMYDETHFLSLPQELGEPIQEIIVEYFKNKFHLGKASRGWKFHFHKTDNWDNFEMVKELLQDHGWELFNCSNEICCKKEFLDLVIEKQKDCNDAEICHGSYFDEGGYWFDEYWFR